MAERVCRDLYLYRRPTLASSLDLMHTQSELAEQVDSFQTRLLPNLTVLPGVATAGLDSRKYPIIQSPAPVGADKRLQLPTAQVAYSNGNSSSPNVYMVIEFDDPNSEFGQQSAAYRMRAAKLAGKFTCRELTPHLLIGSVDRQERTDRTLEIAQATLPEYIEFEPVSAMGPKKQA